MISLGTPEIQQLCSFITQHVYWEEWKTQWIIETKGIQKSSSKMSDS